MKQFLYIDAEPAFHKIVIASAVLHILLIIFASVPVRTKEKEYKNYFVNLVGPADVQRPVTSARRKETVLPKPIEKSPAKGKEALKTKLPPQKMDVPKKGVSLQPEKSAERVSREIERLQALKALSTKKKHKEEQAEKGRRDEEEVAQAIEIIRKNKLGDLPKGRGGLAGSQSEAEINLYISLIQQKIWDEWIHPQFSSEDLEAVLSFQIDRKGNIISPKIVTSSGNYLFDHSAMKAILKAGPVPPPAVEDEYVVRFHL